MSQWLKRVRGAVGTGVLWAVAWAPVAVIVGTKIIDPDDSMDEMWFMVGALPGFLSGVVFSLLVSRFARHQKLGELSIARTARWGAMAGAAIGALPFILGDTGGRPWIGLAAGVIGTFAFLSAGSAAGSLVLAQRAERRELRDANGAHDMLGDSTHDIAVLPDGDRLPSKSRKLT